MTYEAFLSAWDEALRRSGLYFCGRTGTKLDLRTLDRVSEAYVEPIGGQFAEPFHVTAGLSFRWSPLLTARAGTIEEDVLIELLGPDATDVDTELPWVRVDVVLRATLGYGASLPMPAPERWARWANEAITRLGALEPVIDEEVDDFEDTGPIVGGWQGEPTATFQCGREGALSLERIEMAAWQAVTVPRCWDDSTREADAPPDAQLERLFARVRSSLHVWSEVLDHLVGGAARG